MYLLQVQSVFDVNILDFVAFKEKDMNDSRLLYCLSADSQDCSDMHSWQGVRNLYVLHIVTKGEGYLEVNGTVHRLQKGQIFAIYPDVPVYYHPDKQNPYSYKWVDFSGSLAKSLMDCTAFSVDKPVSPPLDGLESMFDAVRADIASERCKAPLLGLLSKVIERYPSKESLESEIDYVARARDYMLANLHKPSLKVSDAADFAGICRSQLYRAFSQRFGVSPKRFIADERMKSAKKLLRESGLPISYISGAVGFDDPLYFSAAFKKTQGISPSQYRKAAEKQL